MTSESGKMDEEFHTSLDSQPLISIDPQLKIVAGNISTPRRVFTMSFVVFITFMQTLTYVMTFYVINEYALYWFKQELYPNSTFSSNQSKCININTSSESFKEQEHVQAMTSKWSIYVSLANGIPVILSGTLLSSLTDNYGRKRFIVIPIFGTFLKNTLCALAVYRNWNIYLFAIFLFVEGAAGGWVTTLSIGSACAADLTSPDKSRSFMLTLMAGGIGIGFVSGTLLAGYIIQIYHFLIPIIISASLSLVTFLLIVILFTDTLPENKRTKDFNLCKKVQNLVEFYWKDDSGKGFRTRYIIAIVSFGFIEIGFLGKTSVEIYYATDTPYCMTPVLISVFASVRGLAQELIGTLTLRLLQVCLIDEVITILGLVSGIGYLVVVGAAMNKTMLFLAPVAGLISVLPITLLRSIMSKMTPPHKQGALFGSIAFFENIYNMTGNVMTGAIYFGTIRIYRGLVFFILAGMHCVALVLVVILALQTRKGKFEYEETYSENESVNKNPESESVNRTHLSEGETIYQSAEAASKSLNSERQVNS